MRVEVATKSFSMCFLCLFLRGRQSVEVGRGLVQHPCNTVLTCVPAAFGGGHAAALSFAWWLSLDGMTTAPQLCDAC